MRKFWTYLLIHFRRWLREPRIIYRSDFETLKITIEVRSWLPFMVFMVALVWYIASPTPIAMMSAVTLGGILGTAYLWARAMATKVRGRRKLRFSAMQVGDELEELVGLRNYSRIPVLWAEFVDLSNIPGYTVSSARTANPLDQVEWRAHTVCTRRGVFNLGPWEMRLGEPFGLFLTRQVYLEHQEILVYPPLAELPRHLLPHRGALGDHRPLNQPIRASTISVTTVRKYSYGDPLHQIHWRTTARHESPFVKVFAPETASSIWLVPDFDSSVHLGDGPDSSEEVMVTVIASLAAELLQQNLAVGLLASADLEKIVLPRQRQTHLWAILQSLAPLRISPNRPLDDVLERARSLISGNDLLVVVTPSLSTRWIASLRRITHRRGSLGQAQVILLDPVSFGVQGGAENHLSLFLEQGISAALLKRDDVRTISGYYGEISRWEFAVLGTGRVVTRKMPRVAGPLLDNAYHPFWKQQER